MSQGSPAGPGRHEVHVGARRPQPGVEAEPAPAAEDVYRLDVRHPDHQVRHADRPGGQPGSPFPGPRPGHLGRQLEIGQYGSRRRLPAPSARASTTPASVSRQSSPGGTSSSETASRALQSAALPHIAAREPSEFQKIIRTGCPPAGVSMTRPSAPTPLRRSQSAVTRAGRPPFRRGGPAVEHDEVVARAGHLVERRCPS